jgi:hypothetical protein
MIEEDKKEEVNVRMIEDVSQQDFPSKQEKVKKKSKMTIQESIGSNMLKQ